MRRFEGAHIPGQRVNLRRGQFLSKSRHHTRPVFDGVENLPVRGVRLPFCVGKVLCPDQPAVESPGAPVLAVADDTIFRKQPMGIHLVWRIIGLLNGQWPGRCTTRNQEDSRNNNQQARYDKSTFHISRWPKNSRFTVATARPGAAHFRNGKSPSRIAGFLKPLRLF